MTNLTLKMQKTGDEAERAKLERLRSYDEQIEHLMKCKPLPESQVKDLCEEVSFSLNSSASFCQKMKARLRK